MNFCKLEKDWKTYQILNTYFEDHKIKKDLDQEDNNIQVLEIEDHNKRNNKDVHDSDEAIKWITCHGKNYRLYLDSIKELAMIIYCSRSTASWENFCYFVDRYNEGKDYFLEKISKEKS